MIPQVRAATARVHRAAIALVCLLLALPAVAAPRERVVVAFGDSLTAGYLLPARDGFTQQLERALNARGHRVQVVNAGVSGDTSAGGRARLGWVIDRLKTKPDLVILELGANDMLRGIDPAITRANLDAMLTEFARRRIPVVLAGMFSTPSMGIGYVDAYNRIFPELARKHGAIYYPFFMKGVALNRPLLLADNLHPNARGVAVMVANIAPTIERALAPKPMVARVGGAAPGR